MLENIGLGGVLGFDHKDAIAGMESAGSAAKRFNTDFGSISETVRTADGKMRDASGRFVSVAETIRGADGRLRDMSGRFVSGGGAAQGFAGDMTSVSGVVKNMGEGFKQAGVAMGGLALATAPVTVGFGAGFNTAVDFEKQMSAVGAVTRASAEDMARLTIEAKKQGASTAFSASEAAKGMEALALGGFDVNESIAAIGPVLSAAAADNMSLEQSASIVSDTLKGMGLPVTDATTGISNAARVADVLAMTSGKTSTSIAELGESMKYAAPQAKTMGISIETTSAMLGVMADAGLKGSLGGTAFTQALVKLASPSKEGAELIQQLGLKFTKTADGGLDVVDVFKQVNDKTKGMSDVMQKSAVINELFGVRGAKAFTSMQGAIDTGKIDQLGESLLKAKGYADEMAATRMDNFAGAMEQLKGAVEGFALETSGLFLGPAKDAIGQYSDVLSNIVLVMTELNATGNVTAETANKAGPTLTAVAFGIKEGIEMVIDAWKSARKQVTDFIQQFVGGQSQSMIFQFTKIATVITLIVAAVAPVMAVLSGVAFFVSSVLVPAFTAVGSAVAVVFSAPVLAAVAIAVGAFMAFREEGETVGQTIKRMVNTLVQGFTDGFNWIMENAVKPFIAGFEYIPSVFDFVWEKIKDFVFEVKTYFSDLISGIMQAMKALAPFFRVVWTLIGNIVGVVVAGIGLAFTTMLDVVSGIMHQIRAIVLSVLESVVNFIKTLSFGIGYVGEALGFDWGKAMQDFGTNEFKIEVGVERGLHKKIGEEAIDTTVSQELIDQANNELLGMQVGQAVADNMPKEINVQSKVCVDGKTIAKATAKHQQEIHERAGFKTTPWARRAAVEHGAAPVPAGA